MKVLLATNGSRGDVHPLLALAVELRLMGHSAIIGAAPNFQSWVESFGIDFVPVGIAVNNLPRRSATGEQSSRPAPEVMRQLVANSVADQFRVLAEVAPGRDVILVGMVLQNSGRSIAEWLNIPYVYTAFCPATLPTPDYPPAKAGPPYPQGLPAEENEALWRENERSYNGVFQEAVNEQRVALGLQPVDNLARYTNTDQPWLAADPALAPAGRPLGMKIWQPGAWFLADPTPLPDAVEAFLAAGDPPIYFGFGSMRVAEQTGNALAQAANALGYRAIISQGWSNLAVSDVSGDYITIGDVDHTKLFARVTAIVHHGGAGTTTAAARAGKPQVIVPHMFDQYYWAHRAQELSIGATIPSFAEMTVDTLVAALRDCLTPEVAANARALASRIELCGARIAAERLVTEFA